MKEKKNLSETETTLTVSFKLSKTIQSQYFFCLVKKIFCAGNLYCTFPTFEKAP